MRNPYGKPMPKNEMFVCACGKKCKTITALNSHFYAMRFQLNGQRHSFVYWVKNGTVGFDIHSRTLEANKI